MDVVYDSGIAQVIASREIRRLIVLFFVLLVFVYKVHLNFSEVDFGPDLGDFQKLQLEYFLLFAVVNFRDLAYLL